MFSRVRMAGIKGLQGVVRKTARGQLRMNALQSMEKIIPALLFNIHEKYAKYHNFLNHFIGR